MTTTPASRERGAGPRSARGRRTHLDHSPTDGAGPVEESRGSLSGEGELRELLGPFVAWLATQDLDEAQRRRHRDATERFLRWAEIDTGPVEDRRRRYEHHLHRHDPDHLRDARAGLGWWAQHRQLLAWTLPADR